MKRDMICPECKKKGFSSKSAIWGEGARFKCSECGVWSESDYWKLPGVWVEVSDRLPRPGVPVIAFVAPNEYGKHRTIRAQHAPLLTLEQGPECEGGTYDEATDTYYCDEGWYETNEYEEVHWNVDGVVTHWMALPLPPVE